MIHSSTYANTNKLNRAGTYFIVHYPSGLLLIGSSNSYSFVPIPMYKWYNGVGTALLIIINVALILFRFLPN